LTQKLLGEKKGGVPTQRAEPSWQVVMSCGDHDHSEGIITIEGDGSDIDTKQ
jgi:hypothetical protein